MGLLTLAWLALVSISAIIGCRSFAFRTLNTRRCGIMNCRHALLSNPDITEGDVTCKDEKEIEFGLYIHIPYCRQRCRYCDFAIVPIGDHGSTKNDQDDDHETRREQGFRLMNDRYVSAVVAELQQIAARNTNTKVHLRSIYFGGGTPSLAPIESIESILYHACGKDNPEAPFRLVVDTEITMEMDPGTFDREHLSSLHDLGINRVSLGVQSFDDDILCAMGRTHRRADVLQAVRDIAFVFGKDPNDCKIDDDVWENVNYSIDLISGCPGLTPAKWVETLQEATIGVETKKKADSSSAAIKERKPLLLSSLPPPKHISVYDMQIEEGTVFGKWAAEAEKAATVKRNEESTYEEDDDDEDEDHSRQFTVALPLNDGNVSSGMNPAETPSQQQRILRLPSEDECAFMYKYAAGYLRSKKYEHYEVSSYAAFSDSVNYKTKHDADEKEKDFNPRSKRSKHNQIYWEYDGQWHAVGLGATSFVDRKSIARPRQMKDYIEWVSDGSQYATSTNDEADDNEDKGVDEDFLSDILLKRLRTIDGLDLSWLETNYGSEIVEKVLEGAKLGLDLELAERTDENILRLRDPEGLLYSNFIISSIYAELGYT